MVTQQTSKCAANGDQDKVDAAYDREEQSFLTARKWLSLRNYLAEKLAQQVKDEGLSQEANPIRPFDIKEAEVKAELKKANNLNQFDKVMKIKTDDRNAIIQLIDGLEPIADWSDEVSFVSMVRLVTKLDEFSDEEHQKKEEWAHVSRIAQSCYVKEQGIELVANKLNDLVDDAYELIIDDLSTVH